MVTLRIFGMGCPRCKVLAERTEQAIRERGLDFRIERVTDSEQFCRFRITAIPALVVDGEVKVVGRVPSVNALKALLT